jgi:hypothetical protein
VAAAIRNQVCRISMRSQDCTSALTRAIRRHILTEVKEFLPNEIR